MEEASATPTVAELWQQTDYLRCIIDSLDPGADDHDQVKRELDQQLQQLDSQLDAMTQPQQPMAGPSYTNGEDQNAADAWLATPDWTYQNGHQSNTAYRTADTMNGAHSFAQPGSRKRSGAFDDHANGGYSSKRPTPGPSPAATTPGTPSSQDSLELLERSFRPPPRRPVMTNPGTPVTSQQLLEQRRQSEARELQRRQDDEVQRAWELQVRTIQNPQPQPTLNGVVQSNYGQSSDTLPPFDTFPALEQSHFTPQNGFARPLNSLGSNGTPSAARSAARAPSVPQGADIIDLCGSSDSDIEEIMPRRHPEATRASVPVFGQPSFPQSQRDPFGDLDRLYTGRPSLFDPQQLANPMFPAVQGLYQQAPVLSQQTWLQAATNAISNAGRSVMNTFYDGISTGGGAHADFIMPGNSATGFGSHAYRGNAGDPMNFDRDVGLAPLRYPPALYRDVDYYDYKTQQEDLQKMLANIRPDENIPAHLREGTPEALNVNLSEHQKLGLAWLKSMEEGTNKGGILADDMGLGKTIQALSLLVSRPSEDPRRKTTLIVAPVSLMKQWQREIKDRIRPGQHALRVHIFHGSGTKKTFRELSQFDVVLTSYGTLASELTRRENGKGVHEHEVEKLGKSQKDQLKLLGSECLWYRVILDEAQAIKNRDTKTSKAACELKSVHRICMTGTPMMNRVDELYGLIRFLKIPPYHDWKVFRLEIKAAIEKKDVSTQGGMRKLQALLKAILLRRTKDSKIDGRPIIDLPPKTVVVDHVEFDADQEEFYRALEGKTQLRFNKYLKSNAVGKSYTQILTLLLRLRQACCHPHLIKDFAEPIATDLSKDEMLSLAAQLSGDVVARIKAEEGAFSCPICFDAVANPAIFLPCGHNACSECFSRLTDPTRAIETGDGDGRREHKCPNCRGGIDPKRIIDYQAFKKVHCPELAEGEDDSDTSDSDVDSDEVESDGDDNGSDLADFVVPDDEVEESETRPKVEGAPKAKASKPEKSKKKKGKGKAKPTQTLAQLRKLALRSQGARAKYFKRLTKNYVGSAKIDLTVEILKNIRRDDPTEKTLVFSQWTSLIDILEVPVSQNELGYVRYDGTMSSDTRNEAVNQFIEDPNCTVMLLSLKAGNAGLNLNSASQVIILDPFWNPYIEYQAIDRAHRFGQRRQVTVHRLLVPNTVEDRIMELQKQKEELISTALDERAGQSIARLGTQELAYLFGVRNTLPGQRP